MLKRLIRHGVTKEHKVFKLVEAMYCCHDRYCALEMDKRKVANIPSNKSFLRIFLSAHGLIWMNTVVKKHRLHL